MIEQQLQSYEQRVNTRQKNKKTSKELMAYSATALGVAVIAPEAALGAIVHKTTTMTVSAGKGGYGYWNIDNAGTGKVENDFGFYFNNFSAKGIAIDGGLPVASSGKAELVSALASGFIVGTGLATGGFFNNMALSNKAGAGNFSSATAYMGFKFNGDTGTVGTQYGWAKVKVLQTTPRKLQIKEWAYQNDGSSIAVKDTGAVSNPISADVPEDLAPLTLLALGAAGLFAYRRRRDDALVKIEHNA